MIRKFLLVKLGVKLLRLLFWTCRVEVEGFDRFIKIAKKDKSIVMLWHNNLLLTPFIYRYASQFEYAPFISKSRDGELLSAVVEECKLGKVITVPHDQRHEALRQLIQHVNKKNEIVVITPDGPRGPPFKLKLGIAKVAIETGAHVFPLSWTANRFWQLKTWDKMKIPKPFSKITISMGIPVTVKNSLTLNESQEILQNALNNNTSIDN